MLVPTDIADCAKARALIEWVTWSVGSYEGKLRATRLHYAVLPADILPRVNEVLKAITCNKGQPVS
jgi:hypothetical protein